MLVLRPSDLRLVPPAAVIRSPRRPGAVAARRSRAAPPRDRSSASLPSPPSSLTEPRRRRGSPVVTPPPSAPDVTALLRYIGHEMTVRGRLVDPWTLYATEVRPEIWARTEELTDGTDRALTAHLVGGPPLEVPVRHTAAGEAVGAISDQGIAVFLAGDHDALGTVIGRYLVGLRLPARSRRPAPGGWSGRRRPSGWTRIRSGPARRPASSPGQELSVTRDNPRRPGGRNHMTVVLIVAGSVIARRCS